MNVCNRLDHGSGVAARSDYFFLAYVSVCVVDDAAVSAGLYDVERCSSGWLFGYNMNRSSSYHFCYYCYL